MQADRRRMGESHHGHSVGSQSHSLEAACGNASGQASVGAQVAQNEHSHDGNGTGQANSSIARFERQAQRGLTPRECGCGTEDASANNAEARIVRTCARHITSPSAYSLRGVALYQQIGRSRPHAEHHLLRHGIGQLIRQARRLNARWGLLPTSHLLQLSGHRRTRPYVHSWRTV
jgi:hypothetical protein